MKLLRLGNSQDTRGVVDERDSIAGVEETVFERLTGEPLETVVKRLWPAEELDEIVTRWMVKEDPDAVLLCYTNFWVAFPSVPLRIQRRFGSVGMQLAKAGTTVAANDRLAYNPVFRSFRKAALSAIGGDYHFEPSEAGQLVERAVRAVLRFEPTLFVVRGPVPHAMPSLPAKFSQTLQQRTEQLDGIAADLCRQTHVPFHSYLDFDQRLHPEQFDGDDLHLTAAGMAYRGEREGTFLAEEWLKVRAGGQSGRGRLAGEPQPSLSDDVLLNLGGAAADGA